MISSSVQRVLSELDKDGRYVYTVRDLALLFDEDGIKLKKTLARTTRSGLLIHAAHGVYVYAYSRHLGPYTIEAVARALRRGEYCYVSFESALSAYGVISQIPIDRLTVATSGRSAEYVTPFGVIEFTHTERDPLGYVGQLLERPPHPLPIADRRLALRNLSDVRRSLDLVDLETMEDEQ